MFREKINLRMSRYGTKLATLSIVVMMLTLMLDPAYAGESINIREAVQLALSSNSRIMDSNSHVNAASASVTATRGDGLPSLNVEVNAARSNNPLNVFSYKLSQGSVSFNDFGAGQYTGPQSLGIEPHNLNSPGYYNNYNTGVVLNVPIFSGGDATAKTNRAKALLKAAKEGNQAAKNELIYDLVQSYAGWHAANRIVSLTEQSVNVATKYLDMTNKLYNQSIILQSDVMMMRAYHRSLQTKLHATKLEALNQIDIFRTLLGKPNSTLIPGSEISLQLSRKSMNQYIEHGLENNPKIKALRSEISARRSALSSAESSDWPQLNLQLRHDWNANTPALNASSNTAMLELNWKLFSSGSQYGSKKQAQALLEQSNAVYDGAADNIRLAITETLREIQNDEMQITSIRQNIREIENATRLLYSRYGQGLIPLGQLLDAHTRLDDARIQLTMNEYRRLLAETKVLMLTNQLMTALNLNDKSIEHV